MVACLVDKLAVCKNEDCSKYESAQYFYFWLCCMFYVFETSLQYWDYNPSAQKVQAPAW